MFNFCMLVLCPAIAAVLGLLGLFVDNIFMVPAVGLFSGWLIFILTIEAIYKKVTGDECPPEKLFQIARALLLREKPLK